MAVAGDPARRLRALHEAYVWEVNAAIGEGREDLVGRLNDQFLAEALEVMAGEPALGCERPDCPACTRPTHEVSVPVRSPRWWRRIIHR